jgi:hypothetical protein
MISNEKFSGSKVLVSNSVLYVSSYCTNTVTAEANLRVLCYGLVFFSVVGLIGRILGLLSDDSDLETPEKEDIPLPGFFAKSTVEVIDAAVENSEEEKNIRRSHRGRVAIYKFQGPRSNTSTKEVTPLPRDSPFWVPALETLMFVYPGVL